MKKIISLLAILTFYQLQVIAQVPDSQLIKNILHTIEDSLPDDPSIVQRKGQEALQIAYRTGNKRLIFKTYRNLGYHFENINRVEDAFQHYEKATAFIPDITPVMEMDIYYDLAITKKKLGDYKTAKIYYEKTITLAEKEHESQMICYGNSGLAYMYQLLNDADKAIFYGLKTQKIAEEIRDTAAILAALWTLGNGHLVARDTQRALFLAYKARLIAEKWTDSLRLAGSYIVQAKFLYQLKRYAEALPLQLKAIEICSKIRENRVLVEAYIEIAKTYVATNRLNEALLCYQKCDALKSFIEAQEYPDYYIQLGKLHIKTGAYPKAETHLKAALQAAHERQSKSSILEIHQTFAELYTQTKDFVATSYHLRLASAYQDSIYSDDKVRRIAEAQFKYDVEKAEAETQKLQLIQTATQQRSRILLAALVLTLLLGVVLIYFYQKIRYKNAALNQANTALSIANQRLEHFVHTLSHDALAYINHILNFANFGKSSDDPVEVDLMWDKVIQFARRLKNMSQNLIQFKIKRIPKFDKIDLTQLLAEVREDMEKDFSNGDKILHIAADLPPVVADYEFTKQIFRNLIGNAVKFSKPNTPLSIHVKTQQKTADWVEISVEDNGIGISEVVLPHIFEEFKKGNSDTEGSGLGLFISHQLVESMGGTIGATSELEKGSRFYFMLRTTFP
jgi:signal transduction histidine kinase